MKQPPASKSAPLPRRFDFAKSYLSDWERPSRSSRYNMLRMKAMMLLLIANGELLCPEWEDYPLKGERPRHRECHVGGDFLLIYRVDDAGERGGVVFIRAGTHSELFQ